MIRQYLAKSLLLLFISFHFGCYGQEQSKTGLDLYIDPSVENVDGEDEKEIISLWQEYLLSKTAYASNNSFWHSPNSRFPDAFLFPLQLREIDQLQFNVQNSIIGVFNVELDHYCLKSMFSKVDSSGQIILNYITSVYAKKVNNEFKLVNSTDYHRLIWRKEKLGNIEYYIHPAHEFKIEEAQKMNTYNSEIAEKFGVEPIEVEYFLCNYGRDLLALQGFDFTPKSYIKIQSGGMAFGYDNIIYAGNNSAYYPHELIHLYTHQCCQGQFHQWADEGVATFFGGSTGYSIDWHIDKLRLFLIENPDYALDDLSALNTDIPNGEFKTNFMYALGGFFIKQIYQNEGMEGIMDALKCGRTESDYFNMLEQKLGINKYNFSAEVRKRIVQ